MKDAGKSSSRKLHRVIYYTVYRMDPQTMYKKYIFCTKHIKHMKITAKCPIYFPLTPDRLPFKGGCYVNLVLGSPSLRQDLKPTRVWSILPHWMKILPFIILVEVRGIDRELGGK